MKVFFLLGTAVLFSSFTPSSVVDNNDEVDFFGRVCETVRVTCPAGSRVKVSVNKVCLDFEGESQAARTITRGYAADISQQLGENACNTKVTKPGESISEN